MTSLRQIQGVSYYEPVRNPGPHPDYSPRADVVELSKPTRPDYRIGPLHKSFRWTELLLNATEGWTRGADRIYALTTSDAVRRNPRDPAARAVQDQRIKEAGQAACNAILGDHKLKPFLVAQYMGAPDPETGRLRSWWLWRGWKAPAAALAIDPVATVLSDTNQAGKQLFSQNAVNFYDVELLGPVGNLGASLLLLSEIQDGRSHLPGEAVEARAS